MFVLLVSDNLSFLIMGLHKILRLAKDFAYRVMITPLNVKRDLDLPVS